ncbi:TonB-dependent receptor plug domain-containing protein [Saccharicrinis aurantiacus]|uniref:TonB-dependent receptor plug domain-containing protein n=1 Tax=Saccharicrinis aurantiacus TaxID=1849719 RepID=UPI00095005F8|nr:TonB-dependent receptor [Saccharicrinis aurantiacus]
MKMKSYSTSNSEVVTFKRWSRKGFALFSTIGSKTKIATLATAYFLCGFNTVSWAQEDTASINQNIDIREVEVSARRSPALYSEVGRVVNVITRKEIESLPVQSPQDLLKYVMGVDVRQRGPMGIQADVSIRGGSFDQVMILLNGINITDPQTGHLSLNLPIDMQSIERVEVLEGPGSRVHGPNAFSGAINFVTGTKEKNNITVNAMGGDFGLYNVGGNATIIKGNTKNYIAANKSASNGFMANTDFDSYNVFYQGQLDLQGDKLDLQVGHTDKEFGANSFYSAAYPNQFEQNKTTFASLSFQSDGKIKLKPSIYWRRHQDRFELFRDYEDAASWYDGHNYHLTDVFGANMNAVIPWVAGKTAVGGDFRSENVWSNVLGLPMDEPIDVPGEPEGTFTNSYSRSNASFFLEHTYTHNRLSVSAGLMANYNSGLGFGFDYFPGIDASYWITSGLKGFASVNKSLRMPTFTDLFYNGPTNVGNPNLKPEEATTYEAGFKYLESGINATLVGFYRDGKNMIDWGIPTEELGDNGKYTTSNINDIATVGIEASANINFAQLVSPNFFVQNVNLNYAWLDQSKDALPGYTSAYVFNYLKHKFNAGVSHKLISNLGATWNFLYQDRMGEYTDVVNGNVIDYDPFWLCDLRVHWTKPKYTIYAEASNIFNNDYVDFGNINQPGRWFRAGIKINLDL